MSYVASGGVRLGQWAAELTGLRGTLFPPLNRTKVVCHALTEPSHSLNSSHALPLAHSLYPQSFLIYYNEHSNRGMHNFCFNLCHPTNISLTMKLSETVRRKRPDVSVRTERQEKKHVRRTNIGDYYIIPRPIRRESQS